MGDPLSVAASVAGLLSLGIQVTQSLVDYYTAYRNQDSHIARTTSKLESLSQSFQSLKEILENRRFQKDECALVGQIESSIENCDDLILELQEQSKKFLKASNSGIKDSIKTASRRSAYPFQKSTLQKLDIDIGEIRENLSLALNVLQLSDNKRNQEDLVDVKSILDFVRTSQISQEIRDWLKAPDASTNFNEACTKRHPQTGTWLVKGPVFASWLEDNNSFLWLNGFAGCGKSVLSSTAIQYTFRHRRSNPRIGVAFYYFSFNDSSKQDVSGLLRAILWQLSSQLNDGHSDLVRLHASYKNSEPPTPALLECVKQLVPKFDDVYIIVDALDESPRTDARSRVLKAIKDIRKWSLHNLHVLVTSRDEPDIRQFLKPSSSEDVSMKNSGIDKDIEDFIRGHLEHDEDLERWSNWHSKIQDALTAKANGVFRWVECQFTALKFCPRSEAHLEQLLKSLPQSLDETYERILLNIDRPFWEDARLVLMWLCFSKRPMTVRSLIDGIAIELGDDARFNRKRKLQDASDILQICPGFISVALSSEDNENSEYLPESEENMDTQVRELVYIVSIAHYSVQEYLESDRIRNQSTAFFNMERTRSEAQIAQMCLVYLVDPVLSTTEAQRSTLNELPLAYYAARYWYDHFNASGTFSSEIHAYVRQLFRGPGNTFQSWVNIYDQDRRWRSPFEKLRKEETVGSALYYAALLGLEFILNELLSVRDEQAVPIEHRAEKIFTEELNVNVCGGRHGYALQAASINGHEKVAQLLLDHGANVHAQGGDYGNALQAASLKGHERVVQVLLDHGADVHAQGRPYGNALQAASYRGDERVVQLLLHHGADVHAQGGQYGNALQAASLGGHERVVQVLLDHGADVHAQGRQYGNALQAASLGGHERVVQVLLDHGADVHAQGGQYGNALQAASYRGHERVVQVLLDHGADVHAQGRQYGNALQAASLGGHERVVQLLLHHGADVKAEGRFGTALDAAVWFGYEKVAQMLLDRLPVQERADATKAAAARAAERDLWVDSENEEDDGEDGEDAEEDEESDEER